MNSEIDITPSSLPEEPQDDSAMPHSVETVPDTPAAVPSQASTAMSVKMGMARFFSTVFSPLLIPTYVVILTFWCSFLSTARTIGNRVATLMVIFGITCILPMVIVAVLHNLKIIDDKRLIMRSERHIPYVFALLCYIGAFFYLEGQHEPRWFTMFMIGSAAACLVSFVVNFYWKISAHMAGIGGIIAYIYQLHAQRLEAFNMINVMAVAILLAGVLGSSRILMRRHTALQVVLGFVNGIVCVAAAIMLFG